jgi:hypothetical protein
VPYRARMKIPLKLTRSVFMFIPQSSRDSSHAMVVACCRYHKTVWVGTVIPRRSAWKLYIIQCTPRDALLSAKIAGCQEIRWL